MFEKPGGKKITKEEFLELAKKIEESKLTKEQLKELIERSRNPESGKLKLAEATRSAGKEEMPPAPPPRERKIDYPRASKQNVIYQKMRGWDPVTFVKKPGIKVESDEFANAVYDMQEALRVKADGILGDETLVAFYDKNKKKPDVQYEEAKKNIEEKRAAEVERKEKEKATKDKAAADKAAAGKGGVASLPASVKVVNAHQHVPDDKYDIKIPEGIDIYIPNPWSLLMWTGNPPTYKMKSSPKFVTLDLYVNKKHEYRIEYVAVKEIFVKEIVVLGYPSDFSFWILTLDMEDGIKVQTSNGLLVHHRWEWPWD